MRTRRLLARAAPARAASSTSASTQPAAVQRRATRCEPLTSDDRRCARRRARLHGDAARCPACTTCATRSPPRPARIALGVPPRRHRARGSSASAGITGRLQVKRARERRDRDRRQLQRQSRLGARRDRRAGRVRRRRACWCSATWARSATRGRSSIARSARYARERGIDALLALGELTRAAAAAFGAGARHFDDVDDADRRALAAALHARRHACWSRARASCGWSASSQRARPAQTPPEEAH